MKKMMVICSSRQGCLDLSKGIHDFGLSLKADSFPADFTTAISRLRDFENPAIIVIDSEGLSPGAIGRFLGLVLEHSKNREEPLLPVIVLASDSFEEVGDMFTEFCTLVPRSAGVLKAALTEKV